MVESSGAPGAPVGVKGWLLVLAFLVAVVHSVARLLLAVEGFERVAAPTWPGLERAAYITAVVDLVLAAASILVGYLLWSVHPRAPRAALWLLGAIAGLLVAWPLIFADIASLPMGDGYPWPYGIPLVWAVLATAAAAGYLVRSRRVAATYTGALPRRPRAWVPIAAWYGGIMALGVVLAIVAPVLHDLQQRRAAAAPAPAPRVADPVPAPAPQPTAAAAPAGAGAQAYVPAETRDQYLDRVFDEALAAFRADPANAWVLAPDLQGMLQEELELAAGDAGSAEDYLDSLYRARDAVAQRLASAPAAVGQAAPARVDDTPAGCRYSAAMSDAEIARCRQ